MDQNLFCVLFLITSGSAFLVVRRFEEKRLQDGSGHVQQAKMALLGEKFDGCLRETLRTKHHKMNHTKITPGQDPDEFLYIMGICWDRLNSEPTSKGGTSVLPIFDD